MDGVVGSDGGGDAFGGLRARQGEAAKEAGTRVDGVEVGVDGVVEVVDVDAAVAAELGGVWVREGAELGNSQQYTDGKKINNNKRTERRWLIVIGYNLSYKLSL